ncbi:hypothetical protein [Neptuniibacter sp.]|uniref:hypothetical protein n=1 Tax=Neptuniibacter sp. TaxID=1962643 RepID=UPI002606A2F0|nr:hypothetical protein [Neptuniibacter sp.]MCP4597816.1 hypothetical protein [Neptuniibacter sp.]
MERIVCWFSCGAASAVATKIAIEANSLSLKPKELVVASIYLKDEHPDSERFLKECESWFGQKIEILTSDKYDSSVDKVIASTRYMSGARGARCTKELKKQVRLDWQRHDDIHVFGMTCEEEKRIDDLLDSENNLSIWPVLIDEGMSKADCFSLIESIGIELPEMYKLGYNNNNCIGCLKAQSPGYWNKIRVDFPEVFETRLEQERMLGTALSRMSANKFINEYPEHFKKMMADADQGKAQIKINSKGAIMVPLRYLPPEAGKHESIYVGDCGFFCEKPAV